MGQAVYTIDVDSATQPKLWELVLKSLRLQIFRGSFPPGTKLVEAELADLYGVSRGPIREALIYLEQEHLVVREPRRGAFVRGVTEKDVREIFGLRQVLENYAAELTCGHLLPEHLERMQWCINRMVELRLESKWEESGELDIEFHRIPLRVSGHRRLAQSWDLLSGSLLTLAATTAPHYPDLIGETQRFHQEMLDAYARDDIDAVKASLAAHVHATQEVMFKMLRSAQDREQAVPFKQERTASVRPVQGQPLPLPAQD
jgi:DNA-binding GntR family transcriptional regulator